MNRSALRKKGLTVLKYGMLALVLFFIVRNINMSPTAILDYLTHTKPLFYYSILVFILFICLQALIWVAMLNESDRHIGRIQGIHIYINSQFAKYLPGGIWNLVGRVYLTSKYGVPLKPQLLALFYEMALLAMVAVIYSLVLMFELGWIHWWALVLSAIIMAVFYCLYDRTNRWVQFVINKFKRFADLKLTMARALFFRMLFYYLLSHIVQGAAFWMVLETFNVDGVDLLFATGTFSLAWLIGLVSPLPGGLGVREGILVFLLALKIDPGLASQIAIITRLWNILGEALLFGMVNTAVYFKKRMKAAE